MWAFSVTCLIAVGMQTQLNFIVTYLQPKDWSAKYTHQYNKFSNYCQLVNDKYNEKDQIQNTKHVVQTRIHSATYSHQQGR